jgi:hypothetical protein
MSLALFNNKIYGSTGEGGRLFQHTVLTAGKSLYIGSTQISNVYLGTINITGQYLGATLVS